jgi:polar amino acid transport system substrate-binding protein
MVPAGSKIMSNDEVDREGVRVAVGLKSAYDLYLTRNIKRATIVRAATSQAAVDEFVAKKFEVVAGVKQPLMAAAARIPGVRVLPGRFMAIGQASGVPKGRDAAARYLREFIEDAKASGFVAEALKRSGVTGASVAPPG